MAPKERLIVPDDEPTPQTAEPARRTFVKGLGGFAADIALRRPRGVDKEKKEKDESRVQEEIERGRALIQAGDPKAFLADPYVVSALYYSSEYFQQARRRVTTEDVQDRIVAALGASIAPEMRKRFMDMLGDTCASYAWGEGTTAMIRPLEQLDFGKGENHGDALDLFAANDSPVRAMARGMVVLAESGWRADDRFATSSWLGGNAAVVFNHDAQEFYRYCHLGGVGVAAGDMVGPGYEIGAVGATGENAMRPGHGGHLHLEINRYDPASGAIAPVPAAEIRARIKALYF